MTFREAKRAEKNKREWIWKSKKLFRKYDQLDMFDYEWNYYCDSCDWYGEDYIIVGDETDDPKTYWVVDNKEDYIDLKHMLELELEIRYK